ncbi:MAG: hypothetical protein P4L86_22240 [Mycobacterium sp.]|nr:hypothetical protein [Mycobacterium sp.]
MNSIHRSTARRLIVSIGIVAAGAAAQILLPTGTGPAQADACYGELQYSYYCSPASGAQSQAPDLTPFSGAPSTNLWPALPGCTGGPLAALSGEC